MSLENPNNLHEFVETNPAGVDPRSEGDDHIRNAKRVLKAAFPGLAGRAWRSVSRAASAALGITDNMTVQKCAAGITLTPGAASTLGNGWTCWVVPPTTGSVTVDPAENINGGATFSVPAGYIGIIICDGTEFYGFIMNRSVPVNAPPFPAGTRMLFQQTTAPSGWTKEVGGSYNDAALRFTTGTVGTGGDTAFSTVMAAGRSSGSHTLTINQIPPHDHPVPSGGPQVSSIDYSTNGTAFGAGQTTGQTGGGQGHSHSLPTFFVKYADVIIASKDA